jgi:hypothetical protein
LDPLTTRDTAVSGVCENPMMVSSLSSMGSMDSQSHSPTNPKSTKMEHLSLGSWRSFVFSSTDKLEFIQNYGAKFISEFNKEINRLLTFRMSRTVMLYSFVFVYSINVVRYLLVPLLWYSDETGVDDAFWNFYQSPQTLSLLLFYSVVSLFEFVTSFELSNRLKIQHFGFNAYIFFIVAVIMGLDALTFYKDLAYYHSMSLAYEIGRLVFLYPQFLLVVLVSNEIIVRLHRIMVKSSFDSRLSLITYEVVVTKEESMRNTTKFFQRIQHIHKLLEFRLLALLCFSVWGIANAAFFDDIADYAIYLFIMSLLVVSGISQPLYYQHVIQHIEKSNNVSFNFSVRILNLEINYLWIIIPVLATLVVSIRNLWGSRNCGN